MPNALVRSWFSHKPKVGRNRAKGRPLILDVPVRKGGRPLGGKPSPTKKGVFYIVTNTSMRSYIYGLFTCREKPPIGNTS
jgi:hypothetical protein